MADEVKKVGKRTNQERLKELEVKTSNHVSFHNRMNERVSEIETWFSDIFRKVEELESKLSSVSATVNSSERDLSETLENLHKEVTKKLDSFSSSSGAAVFKGDKDHASYQIIAVTPAGMIPVDSPKNLKEATERAKAYPYPCLVVPVFV